MYATADVIQRLLCSPIALRCSACKHTSAALLQHTWLLGHAERRKYLVLCD